MSFGAYPYIIMRVLVKIGLEVIVHLLHDFVNGESLPPLLIKTENTLSGSYYPDFTVMQLLHLRDVRKNLFTGTHHRYLTEAVRLRVILHQSVDAAHQQVLLIVFKKRAHVVIFNGSRVTRDVFVVGKAKSVELVQPILRCYPDEPSLILEYLIDKTAGEFVIGRVEFTGLCRHRQANQTQQ